MPNSIYDRHGNLIGRVLEHNGKTYVYNRHGERAAIYDGYRTYDKHGNLAGYGDVSTSLLFDDDDKF